MLFFITDRAILEKGVRIEFIKFLSILAKIKRYLLKKSEK